MSQCKVRAEPYRLLVVADRFFRFRAMAPDVAPVQICGHHRWVDAQGNVELEQGLIELVSPKPKSTPDVMVLGRIRFVLNRFIQSGQFGTLIGFLVQRQRWRADDEKTDGEPNG